MRDIALKYAGLGRSVFPCLVGKKQPATKHGFKDASSDPVIVNKLWSDPDFNIGLATGQINDCWALDIDGELGETTIAKLLIQHGELPITPEQRTGNGRQIFFKYSPGIRNTAKYMGPGLDGRGEGGYCVVAPSLHPNGAFYEWRGDRRISTTPMAEAPEWLIKLAIRTKPEATAPADRPSAAIDGGSDKYVAAALIEEARRVAQAPEGQRNDTLNTAAFSLGTLVGAGALPEHLAVGNLKGAALAAGLDPVETEKTIASGMTAGRAQPRQMPEPKKRILPKPPETKPDLRLVNSEPGMDDYGDENWKRLLLFNEDEEIEAKSYRNASLYLINEKSVAGLFVYDEFADRVFLSRRPRWEENTGELWADRVLEDVDATRATGWLEGYGVKLKPTEVQRCIIDAAKRFMVNPVQEYLGALKWDGKARIDNWLTYYLGAISTPYTNLVGPRWLISAAARAFDPGCQVDTMLILEGPQGLKKSTALRVLATFGGHSYFTDDLTDIGNKDAIMQLQGSLIVEIAELAAMMKKNSEDVKSFLSRRVDKYRPPYGANTVERRRRCVFAGTHNPGAVAYLKDETGARRFWPVRVTACDIAALDQDRDQIWAEAVHRWRSGERYWLEDSEIALATVEQDERQEEEIWAEAINRCLENASTKSAALILTEVGMPQKDQNAPAFKRLAAYMHRIGWKKRRQRVGGSIHPVTVFVKEEENE